MNSTMNSNETLNRQNLKNKNTQKNNNIIPKSNNLNSKSLIPPRTQKCMSEKEKFQNLLKIENQKFQKSLGNNLKFYKWFIDKDKYLDKLKCEINSIDSCNSSQTSNRSTNFTDDSGSVLIIDEKKRIPLDYITKPYVPFEEIKRSFIQAKPFINQNEYYNPYYTVPFSGQGLIMRELCNPKDKFYTNTVRTRHDIKKRIGIDKNCVQFAPVPNESESVEEKIIIQKQYRYKPKTFLHEAREALRKKITSQYIQEHIIEKIIVHEKELIYAKEVVAFKDLCQPIFSKLQEKHYRQYMRKIQSLKPFYDKTTKLEKTLKTLRDDFIKLDMRIISEEDCWRGRVILQNFHYLLKDIDWRKINDWIHCKTDGTLETYRESIDKRFKVNVRERGKKDGDNAWTVKKFYEQWSSNDKQNEVVIVFPNVKSFLIGLVQLKASLFKSLLQLHFIMWTHANLEQELRCFKKKAKKYLLHRNKYVARKCMNKDFLNDRTKNLQTNVNKWMGEPLMNTISYKLYRILLPLCKLTMQNVFPDNFQNEIKDNEIIDSMTLFVDLIMNLFEQRDQIPSTIRKQIEIQVKKKRSFEMRRAKRMCAVEKRLENIIEQMKKNLAPPYKPPRPPGKLPKSILPKRKIIVPKVMAQMAEVDKLYYKAFTDSGLIDSDDEYKDPAAMEILKTLESSCIPYYFDYFLMRKGYIPIYDFKTEIEMTDGDETDKFRYHDVLDDVLRNLNNWIEQKKSLIETHVLRTLFLYEDDSDLE